MYKIPITQFNFKDFKENIYEKNFFTLSLSLASSLLNAEDDGFTQAQAIKSVKPLKWYQTPKASNSFQTTMKT
ncbi:hypothetical protein BB439_03950 [Helicobacter pylori]|nr:hypothetical protein BB439_03950 [Helicobacter pylori]